MPYALLSCSFVTLLYCYCSLNEINGDGNGDIKPIYIYYVSNPDDNQQCVLLLLNIPASFTLL